MTAATIHRSPDAKELVARERGRQRAKGYTAKHDREHGPLILAEAVDALVSGDETAWPWATTFPRHAGRHEQLVKAGAVAAALVELIALEIGEPDAAAAIGQERTRQRASGPHTPENDPHATASTYLEGVRAYVTRRELHWPFGLGTFEVGVDEHTADRRHELICAGALAARALDLILRDLDRRLAADAR